MTKLADTWEQRNFEQYIIQISKKKYPYDELENWFLFVNNNHIHIKNSDLKIMIRIDPPDKSTKYTHLHFYDEKGDSLDINGNVVPRKSLEAHIKCLNQDIISLIKS